MITYSRKMREYVKENELELEQGKDRIFFKLGDNAYKVETNRGVNKSEYNIYEKNKEKYGVMLMKIIDHNKNFKIMQVEELTSLWEYVENKTGIYDEDIECMNLWEVLDKYEVLRKCKKFSNKIYRNFLRENNLIGSEIECSFNWGITKDEKLVCLDFADVEVAY